MQTGGTLYDSRLPTKRGVAILPQPRRSRVLSLLPLQALTRIFGLLLVIAGLLGIGLSIGPIIGGEVSFRIQQLFRDEAYFDYQDAMMRARVTSEQKEQIRKLARDLELPNASFSLYIPKIDVKAQILQNISPYDKSQYLEALRFGVAHAAGTSLPGKSGTTYIFGHSGSDVWQNLNGNPVFLHLGKLDPKAKDEIYLFYNDTVHRYIVKEKYITDASDTQWLKDTDGGEERLILQACWPPGTLWKRVIIVAEPLRTT